MAYLGEDEGIIDPEYQRKAEAAQSATVLRDEIAVAHEGTPLKIVIGTVIGGWLIYRFLMK